MQEVILMFWAFLVSQKHQMVKTKKIHYPNSTKAMNFSTTLHKYLKKRKKEKEKEKEKEKSCFSRLGAHTKRNPHTQ